MDKQLAKLFRDRWQAVEAIEIQEQRAASLDLRWQQLNSLWQLAKGMRLNVHEFDEQEQLVHQRWAKLKKVAQ